MSTFDFPSNKEESKNNDNNNNDNNKEIKSDNKDDKKDSIDKPSTDNKRTETSLENDDTVVTTNTTDNNESKINENISESYLGTCDKVEEIMIGEDNVIKFSGVAKGEACTIVLRGASMHLLDEMERSLHDALCVLTQTIKQSKVVLGGGASEMNMAHAVEIAARKHSGKEALAMDAFANALRSIPTILADNAGFDAADIVTKLR